MERRQINKEADKWLMSDTDNRELVLIMSECVNDEPHLSLSIGGNRELLIQSICETMNREPALAAVMAEAIMRYNTYKIPNN